MILIGKVKKKQQIYKRIRFYTYWQDWSSGLFITIKTKLVRYWELGTMKMARLLTHINNPKPQNFNVIKPKMHKSIIVSFVILMLISSTTFAYNDFPNVFNKIKSFFVKKEPIKSETAPITPVQPTNIIQQNLNKNDCIKDFLKEISNIPSPKSNFKNIVQKGNVFEVKFGDGSYTILSDDTTLSKLRCDDGQSMLPTSDCNDKIILKKVESSSELNIGDIIVFEQNGKLKMHRIVKMQNGNYWTRADNFDNTLKSMNGKIDLNDAPVTFDKIKWKIVGIIYK